MSAGLYPLAVIAEFLGQRPEEIGRRIELDGLPAIEVPTATRPARKVSLFGLHGWLAARTVGEPLTVEQLHGELERCTQAMAARRNQKSKTKEAA